MREIVKSRGWLFLFLTAVAARLVFSAAAGTLSHHPNNSFLLMIDGNLVGTSAPCVAYPQASVFAHRALFLLGGRQETLYGILLAIVGAFIPLILVRLTRNLLPGGGRASIPWLAGWVAAFFPPLLYLSATWRSMLFATALGLLHVMMVLESRARPGVWCGRAVASGFLVLLTRPDYFLAGGLLALGQRVGRWYRVASLFLPILLVTPYNHWMFGGQAPLGGSFWHNVDAGNNPQSRLATIGYGPENWHPEATLGEYWSEVPPEMRDHADWNLVHKKRFMRFVARQPALFVEGLVMKTVRLFDVHRDNALSQGKFENVAYSSSLLAVLVLALAGVGLMLGRGGSAPVARLLVLLMGYGLPMIAIFSLDRTRVVFQAIWLVPAGAVLMALWNRVRRQRAFAEDGQQW